MAEQELPQSILDFRKLSQGITKLREVLKAVEAGKIADLSGMPEEVLGTIAPDVHIDKNLLEAFIDVKMDLASQECVNTFNAAINAEIAAVALFKATAQYDTAKGQSMPDTETDLKNGMARLMQLAVFTDEYQEEAWEDDAVVHALLTAREPALLASHTDRLEKGERAYVMKSQALEMATETTLKAGLARLASAEAIMAGEILRLQSQTDAAQATLDSDDHKAALQNITRNIDWAEILLKNADAASPALRRRWGFESDDTPPPPPTQKLN